MRDLQSGEIDLGGSTRRLNRKALSRVAPEPGQNADEAQPLNALGDDAQSERVTEVDDRTDEVLVSSCLPRRAAGAT